MCSLKRELYVFYGKGACVTVFPVVRALCVSCDKGLMPSL